MKFSMSRGRSLVLSLSVAGVLCAGFKSPANAYDTVCGWYAANAINALYEDPEGACRSYDMSQSGYPFLSYVTATRAGEYAYSGYKCWHIMTPPTSASTPVNIINAAIGCLDYAFSKTSGPPPCGSTGGTNPINIGVGNKYQAETDLAGIFTFARHYNSGIVNWAPVMGSNWRHAFQTRVRLADTGVSAAVWRADGRMFTFKQTSAGWTADADIDDRLERNQVGWRYTVAATGTVETYDANGRLVGIVDRMGRGLTLQYGAGDKLLTVTDDAGRSLAFGYNVWGRVSNLTDTSGADYAYGYDIKGKLVTVTYPDGYSIPHHYESSRFPHALTGVTDENGQRNATWAYDIQGRAILSEHAGGADHVALSYGSDATTATDPLGTSRTYGLTTILGVTKSTGVSQPGGSGCGAALSNIAYDANGNIKSRTDFNGNRTCYSHDLSRNLETLRLEGLGSAACPVDLATYALPAGSLQRKTHTQWHPDWHLETRRAEPKRIATFVYNGQPDPDAGNAILNCAPADALVIDKPIAVLCKKTVQATDDASGQQGFNAYPSGAPRTWRYTYDRYGHVLTEDGPRTDVADIATYDYWPIDAACPGAFEGTGRDKGCRGQLRRVANALGQVTNQVSASGQVSAFAYADGVRTV